ncbi:FAD-dependent oxidoreductase, partial [Streptomyces longwoodensis]
MSAATRGSGAWSGYSSGSGARSNRTPGAAAAGGYVGSGVATTTLAARTLRDLVLSDTPTDL